MAYPGYGAPGGYGAGAPPYGAPQPNQYHAPPPGQYGAPGYGQPYGAPPVADPLYGYFSAVAGQDGQIDARELQTCLTQSGISGSYQPFSLETCRVLIAMLDRDYSGKMGFSEFKELWAALSQWKSAFAEYDRDRSGTVEPHELHAAISRWGYNLTPQALNIIVKRYSDNGRIKFDDFVAAATRLRILTDHFRRRDQSQTGHANFGYDDFIQVVMFS